jgi:superfamily II DNA or RNA helicase
VWVRPTAFRAPDSAPADARIQFHDLYDALIADESRNRLIVDDVMDAVRDGRSSVVLTERTEHLGDLAERLATCVPHCFVLQGGMGRKQLKSVLGAMAAVPAHEARVLLATGRYIGEGFDDARLDTLFLTLPVSWRGTIAQYAGRLHRLYDAKKEVRIYDYADINVPMLARMFDRRCKGYEAIGYSILLQEHGYFVLRFLAEDVGKRLDHVLDAILRALVRQNGSSGR